MEIKIFELFAGVNGAGKSTLYGINHHKDFVRVNTDEVVVQMGLDWRSADAQMKAAKVSIQTVQKCIQMGKSFNQETTLAGQTIKKQIKKIKEQGYQIHLYYVGIATPEIAIERVKHRVMRGGHGIPEEDIRRRYEVSLNNLKEVFPLCDRVRIYDNTENFQVVLFKENDRIGLPLHEQEIKWKGNVIQDILYTQMVEDILKNGFRLTESVIQSLYQASKIDGKLLKLAEVKELYKQKEKLTPLLKVEVEKLMDECSMSFLSLK